MRSYIKGGIVALALLVSGVLISPSAQVSIQRGFSWVTAADGTAAAPSIAFADDTDSGFYSDADPNRVKVAAGGTLVTEFLTSGQRVHGTLEVGAAGDTVLSRAAASSLRVGNGSTPTNTYDITLGDWGTKLSAEGVSVADTATLFLGAAPRGILDITSVEDDWSCTVMLRGDGNDVVAVNNYTVGTCTVTLGSAGGINIDYNAAGASGAGYYVENRRGATRTLRLTLNGA